MIKRIVTNGFWHDKRVEEAIEDLQEDGFDVYEVKRTTKQSFSEDSDTTDIYYRNK